MLMLKALDYAIANNLTPFIAMQNHYNLVYREEEREMMPTLKVIYISYTALLDVIQLGFIAFWRRLDSLESTCPRRNHSSHWERRQC